MPGPWACIFFLTVFSAGLPALSISFHRPVPALKNNLRIADSFSRETTAGFCIDAVVNRTAAPKQSPGADADSAVVMRSGEYIKVHLHAPDREKVKAELAACGKIISWADDDLAAQTAVFSQPAAASAVHIMTDAAGSITREDAAALGITLLDSYITMGDTSLPETCCSPADMYKAMREGCRCSTAQASMDERYQHYRSVLELNKNVLYLCVGSVYTGNYQAAPGWKQKHDPDSRFSIIDTGTASGRLAVAVHLTARFARQAAGAAEVEACARTALQAVMNIYSSTRWAILPQAAGFQKPGPFSVIC